jgi:hypothetical protein
VADTALLVGNENSARAAMVDVVLNERCGHAVLPWVGKSDGGGVGPGCAFASFSAPAFTARRHRQHVDASTTPVDWPAIIYGSAARRTMRTAT